MLRGTEGPKSPASGLGTAFVVIGIGESDIMKAIFELIRGAWLRASCGCRKVRWHFVSTLHQDGRWYGRCLRYNREVVGVPYGDETP